MAISTDSAIEFFGIQDTVTSGSSAVITGSFSVVGDIVQWTNDDDAPAATVALEVTYSVAPTANTTVDLYARLMNVQGINDQPTPNADFQHRYLGSFPVDTLTSAQYIVIDVPLPNNATSQVYEFYVRNNAGQTMSAGWDLYVTPKTIGPHP